MELTRETIERSANGSVAISYSDAKIMAKQLLANTRIKTFDSGFTLRTLKTGGEK